jgi:hypothetical protein
VGHVALGQAMAELAEIHVNHSMLFDFTELPKVGSVCVEVGSLWCIQGSLATQFQHLPFQLHHSLQKPFLQVFDLLFQCGPTPG